MTEGARGSGTFAPAIVNPFLVQFFEGQFAIGPERIDDPDVLVKYLGWFHVCKVRKKSPYLQILLKIILPLLHVACCKIDFEKSLLAGRNV